MRQALLAISEIGERELGHWRELSAAAIEPNPFFEPEFVLPAAAALNSEPLLLVATDRGGDWRGAIPVRHLRAWHHVPVKTLATWRHLYCFFGAPLIGVDDEHEVLSTWIQPGDKLLGKLLGFDLLDSDGPIRQALNVVAADISVIPRVFEEHERAALRRGPHGLSLGLSSKRRRENARLGRRLGEALGSEVGTVDRAGDPAAVEQFLRLEASGWKGARGTALGSTQAHADLFRELCAGFHRLGRLQLLSLQAEGKVAAMKCNFLAGDTIFCFKTAFDESLADFSPGVQLERALADHVSSEEQVALIDTCAEENNGMANRVWRDRRRLVSLAVPSASLSGTLSGLLVQGLAKTRDMIRRIP